MAKKIIIIDNIIFSLQKHGGISVVWYELLIRMLEDPDFECEFIDLPNQNSLRAELDIPSINILKNNLSYLPLQIQRYVNPKVNSTSDKCIFHSSYFRTTSNANIMNVTTIHDFTYEYFFCGLAQRIHMFQKRNSIEHSKKIICVSENTKYDLFKFHPQIKEDQVEVVYNGVSDDYCILNHKERLLINELIPFKMNEYVLYVGDRKSEYKNFKMLVEACNISKFPLVIVGGEPSKLEESFLNEKLGRLKYIHLIGIDNSKLNLLYNCAFSFVYPSLYEGFGIPILEAQKAGCPVICSNQSSIPEVAGNAAFIIDDISALKIADILVENLSRSDQTNKIIDEGFINAKRFSWDKCYQQTKQVYSDVYSSFE